MAKTKWSAHQNRLWIAANIEALYSVVKDMGTATVIGVDPSSTGLGLFTGVWEQGNTQIVEVSRSGKKTNSSFENCNSHCLTSEAAMFKTLKEASYDNDVNDTKILQNVFIFHEEVSVSSHFTGMKAVAIATGSTFAGLGSGMRRFTMSTGYKTKEYVFPLYVSQIKKALTGNHKADKSEIHEALSAKGLEFSDDNQADAYGAFLIGCNMLKVVYKLGPEVKNIDWVDKKGLREFEKTVDEIAEGIYPAVSILSSPRLYKNLMGATKYGKKREEILNI